jgi:PD-(D/E)XK nuclease superfamily
VRREWRGIDILIDFPHDVIVVENKVDSSEHSQQLSRYGSVADGEFSAKRQHFVFLTPLGSDPVDEGDRKVYINYSYQQIASTLANVLELYRDSISDKMALSLMLVGFISNRRLGQSVTQADRSRARPPGAGCAPAVACVEVGALMVLRKPLKVGRHKYCRKPCQPVLGSPLSTAVRSRSSAHQ